MKSDEFFISPPSGDKLVQCTPLTYSILTFFAETSTQENEPNPLGPTAEAPTEISTENKPEEDPDCLDDSIFEECSPAPVELDIQKEVEEAILALK